jgi:hypothetical protein
MTPTEFYGLLKVVEKVLEISRRCLFNKHVINFYTKSLLTYIFV